MDAHVGSKDSGMGFDVGVVEEDGREDGREVACGP